jgi:hypothetical protein
MYFLTLQHVFRKSQHEYVPYGTFSRLDFIICTNILLSPVLSFTLNVCSLLNMRGQVPHSSEKRSQNTITYYIV